MSILDELAELRKKRGHGMPRAVCPYCGQYTTSPVLWKYFPNFKRQIELEELEEDPRKLGEAMADEALAVLSERLKEVREGALETMDEAKDE